MAKKKADKPAEKTTIKIKLVRSGIGFDKSQKATLLGLGLRKINKIVERPNDLSILGMVHKVRHLVEVVE